jgi:hypothetical protein
MALFSRTSPDAMPITKFGARDGADDDARSPLGRLTIGDDAFEHTQLSPMGGRVVKLIFIIIFAVIWNGVTSVFVLQLVRGWIKGNPDWFQTVFMTPFVLIGLGVIAFGIHAFLGLFNPQPILELPRRVVGLGEELSIAWRFSKNPHKVRSFLIEVLMKESATYQCGTDSVTETDVMLRIEVCRADRSDASGASGGDRDIAQTSATITIPADAMHSFEARCNRIHWAIRVHGEIPRWPDINDEYDISITPGSPSEFRNA